jgi:hypothetical protein
MVLTSCSLRRNAILQGTTDNHGYVVAPLPVAPVHETGPALRSRFTMQPSANFLAGVFRKAFYRETTLTRRIWMYRSV